MVRKIFIAVTAILFVATLVTGCGTANAAPAAPAAIDLGEIAVVSREDGSGTRGAFIELFEVQEKSTDGSRTDRTSEEATVVSKTDVMLTTIAGDPAAIGYVSLGSLSDSVKSLTIDGVVASAATMLDGSYKISRPFIIATRGEPTGLIKDFIDFVMSAEGQAVVSGSYVAVDSNAPAYSGATPEGKLVIGGSSSVFPVMEKLTEAYAKVNPAAKIELQSSDSTAGMTGTVDGIFDIGMASRELKDSEKEQLVGLSIAIDGIAVIVNPDNPVENLTREQVKAIFVGETTEWSTVK